MKTNFSSAFRSGALVALLATAACQDQDTVAPIAPADLALDAVAARLDFSTLTAPAGTRVSVSLRALPPAGARLAGIDGSLTWDPRSLRYEGQIAADGWPMAMTNPERAAEGILPLHILHPHGMSEDITTFSFTVLRPGYDQALRFRPSVAVGYDGAELAVRAAESRMDASIASAAMPQMMDMWDWIAHVEGRSASHEAAGGPLRVFGLSDVYGDANGDGAINATDVGYVANAAVGNNVLGPITTSGPRDAVAINVQPVNLPGLGEPGDIPPGLEANGTRLINASDNSFIAQEAVGIDRPIVGEAIPRPPSTTFACFPGTGTYVSAFTDCGVGAGTAEFISLSDVTLTNDRIWIVADIVLIGRDGTRDADIAASLGVDEATLTIEPGTTLWGTDEGAIVVTRAGRIFADGTYSQPITMTCVPPASGPRIVNSSNGCWGGLVITGNATLPDAKVPGLIATIPGRAAGGGIASAVEGMPTEDVYYGGDNDVDDCGSLSYLVVAHGGRRLDANNEFNNITIAGCGTPTDVSYVQAHNGSDDGLEIFGGGFDVDHIYLTANNDDQFDYSFGYEGIVQYVLVQQLNVGDKGFEVDNTENSATYNNTPRTDASMYNFTMVGGTDAATTSKTANNYRNGASSSLFNGLIIQYTQTFKIDTEASCDQILPGDLTWQNTVILSSSAASYSSAAGVCADATGGAQLSGSAEKLAFIPSSVTETVSGLQGTNTLLTARAYASDLQDPFSTQFADFRPLNDGVSAPFAPVTPPSGTGAWFGAFQPTGIVTSLPWSAGWTIGWQLAATP